MNEKKYYNLYLTLKNKILSGEYSVGERLPSKRVTADRFGCSVITVQAAYGMLLDEGYVCSRERSGYYVALRDNLHRLPDVSSSERIIHVCDGQTDESSDFECSVWFKTVRQVMSEHGERLFRRSPSKGCDVLRNAIAEYLLRYRGMLAQPERIIIGSGAEQLYETAVRVLGRDKIYGIEDPSYSQIREVYDGMGVDVRMLGMGKDGIESECLENECIDVLHVTPFNSYPSGVTTSASKRREYLRWAYRGQGYIVEDDFDSEFFIPGQPIESLYSLDVHERVIYINTFSKSLSPSMRLGYMILPKVLLEEYDRKMSRFSCTVPVMDQYVLAEFISNGSFERHLNRERRRMKR